eukprot:TRINITY_DN112329_c0_g1_i1.p1 TRINITY_DN112329_c0_g1~~TRINITY_DN112329_c0_g1_i1.p1  ORF type:complete len:365 (+),score=61.50 TRINITY_DN112329_c0_g1_i1:92-1186(+)
MLYGSAAYAPPYAYVSKAVGHRGYDAFLEPARPIKYGSLHYKGTMDPEMKVEDGLSHEALSTMRFRLNGISLLTSLLGPWLLFVTTSWLLSSWIRYYHRNECVFAIACFFCGLLLVVARAVQQRRLEAQRWPDASASDAGSQASWLGFFALSCTLAFLAGVVLGEYNYDVNMAPFYDYKDLNVATNVDPRVTSGSSYMDASVLLFKNGSYVDVSKSLAYKDGSLYCVAPVAWNSTPFSAYEFWAVGTDCCNPYGGQFWCGGVVGSKTAKAGVRIMDESLTKNYRLAVEQAVAQYKDFQAFHPLFLTWTEDPTDDDNALRKDNPEHWQVQGKSLLRRAAAVHLVLQALAVLAVVSLYVRPLEWLL